MKVDFRLILALFFFFQTQNSFASSINMQNEGAIFCSRNGKFKAILAHDLMHYDVYRNAEKMYEINSIPGIEFKYGSVLVSNDGRSLAWLLLNPFYGFTDRGKNSERIIALAFFHDGQLIKRYSLSSLLVLNSLVGETTGHTYWLRQYNDADQPIEPSLSGDCARLNLETTSFRVYSFELNSGRILKSRESKVWRDAPIVVWGRITKARDRDNSLKITDFHVLKGKFYQESNRLLDETNILHSERWLGDSIFTGVVLRPYKSMYEIMSSSRFMPEHWDDW